MISDSTVCNRDVDISSGALMSYAFVIVFFDEFFFLSSIWSFVQCLVVDC